MILAVDCSKGLNLIFFRKNKIFYQFNNSNISNASEILIPKIESIFKEKKISYKSISKIIIINGPGSFTGIRASITFAKILKLTLSVPIYGFSKFEIVNFLSNSENTFNKTIFIHHNNENFFISKYNVSNKLISHPEIINLKEINFKIPTKNHLISDNRSIGNYLDSNELLKKHTKLSIFNFKLDNLIDMPEKYFQKKYILRPIYVKNFY